MGLFISGIFATIINCDNDDDHPSLLKNCEPIDYKINIIDSETCIQKTYDKDIEGSPSGWGFYENIDVDIEIY